MKSKSSLDISAKSEQILSTIVNSILKDLENEMDASDLTHLQVSIDIRKDMKPKFGIKLHCSRHQSKDIYYDRESM